MPNSVNKRPSRYSPGQLQPNDTELCENVCPNIPKRKVMASQCLPPKKKEKLEFHKLKRNISPTTGVFLRKRDAMGNVSHEFDDENIPLPRCKGSSCTRPCCSQISKWDEDMQQKLTAHNRQQLRQAHREMGGWRGARLLLISLMHKVPPSTRPSHWFHYLPRVHEYRRREKKPLCSWCSTLEMLERNECKHNFSEGSCPLYQDGMAYHEDNPQIPTFKYHVFSPHGGLIEVSKSFFDTTFCIGKTMTQTLRRSATEGFDMGRRATGGHNKKTAARKPTLLTTEQ